MPRIDARSHSAGIWIPEGTDMCRACVLAFDFQACTCYTVLLVLVIFLGEEAARDRRDRVIVNDIVARICYESISELHLVRFMVRG